MNKVYSRIVWMNYPSDSTPINDVNLNKMDYAINEIDDRLISQDTTKADKTTLNNLISDWTINEETGVITITKFNGEQILFDLNLEKVPVSFVLSDDGILIMTTDDGTTFTANIGAMIPILTFNDSDDIAVSVSGSGVNKTYSFSIKTGAITEDKLQPNYLADVKVQVENAKGHSQSASDYASNSHYDAQLSQSYAIGGSGIREGEDTDNSKYYYEQTKGIATGDTSDSYVTFTSDDMANPTDYTDVNLLASGETHSSLFNKVSTMFKNVRYLFKMLGTTDISSIGDGTTTGAIDTLKNNLDIYNNRQLVGFTQVIVDDIENDLDNLGLEQTISYTAAQGKNLLNKYFPAGRVYCMRGFSKNKVQIGFGYDGSAMALRTCYNDVWDDWNILQTKIGTTSQTLMTVDTPIGTTVTVPSDGFLRVHVKTNTTGKGVISLTSSGYSGRKVYMRYIPNSAVNDISDVFVYKGQDIILEDATNLDTLNVYFVPFSY